MFPKDSVGGSCGASSAVPTRSRIRKNVARVGGALVGLLVLVPLPSVAGPIVHAGDTLSIDVLNYAAIIDNSQGRLKALSPENLVVAADGSISIPVAGTVRVAGMSTGQIGRVVESKLSAYVRDPSVNVRLLQQGQLIFLTGATIGTLPFLPGETLSSALGQLREQLQKDSPSATLSAGDRYGGALSRSAIDLRNVSIARDGRVGEQIDAESLLRSGLPGPSLAPGDKLILPSKPVRVDVRGQVSAPGPVYLYATDTLEQAVLAAAPLATASTVDASLVRNSVESPLPLAGAALHQAPLNGDLIVVRAAPHVTVLGQVATAGELTLKNGASLLSALYMAGGPTRWGNVRDVQVVRGGVSHTYDLAGLQHGDLTLNPPLVDGDVVYVPEGHKIDTRLFFQALSGAVTSAYDVTHF